MKARWSKAWKSSTKPSKQRKYRRNAPLHVKGGYLSVHLSTELRTKYARRNARVRTGDTVTVLRGGHRGRSGKVERVSVKRTKVFITGIETMRKDGTKSLYAFDPSNLMITEVNLKDKKREQALRRKIAAQEQEKSPAKQPAKQPAPAKPLTKPPVIQTQTKTTSSTPSMAPAEKEIEKPQGTPSINSPKDNSKKQASVSPSPREKRNMDVKKNE